MRIEIITPAPPGSSYGNRITAVRWAKILRGLGHGVSIRQLHDGAPCDLLIALHARRSYSSIVSFRRRHPNAPIVVALTGTDLYRDIHTNPQAQKSLEIANRIVVLQPKAVEELPPEHRAKARVIYQSVDTVRKPMNRKTAGPGREVSRLSVRKSFDVCVIGHLRAVKDPLRAAVAARLLPPTSRIRIWQVGGAMTKAMARQAQVEMRRNRRYRWLGERSHSLARRILARSLLCVISSRVEGGANILSEAIVQSVPVLASDIDGNVSILGANYPGLFAVGSTRQLAQLLIRAETDPDFLAGLRSQCQKLTPLFNPARERRAWADLVGEMQHLRFRSLRSRSTKPQSF